ncbi:MAG: helicase HerA-like domain-containing protein [Tahibacter sp.]
MTDILLGKSDLDIFLKAKYANRHGLIAGATGTGKSVTLMRLAEGFSQMGVPVFLADVKGDLAGLSQAGTLNDRIKARVDQMHLTWTASASPVVFWDIYGELGHPVRTTISEMGPTLLGRLMELNDTQEGVLEIVFKLADDQGLLLLDLKDLRALLAFAAEHAKEISGQYGLISPQSVGAIQRALLSLDQAGAEHFFGEPALDLADFMRQDMSGRGIVNILAADKLILKPKLYSTFLLWLLSELFERLPEAGDMEQPKLVFFFDEAHLLFDDAPPALVQRVEQVVRLIRSKGVGVYFCSQNPDDVPQTILGQMGNRVQHALRAFTPRDQKAVKSAAETFAPNPKVKNVAEAITQLAVGEALVSTLQEGGIPLPVERALIAPPVCRIGVVTDAERNQIRSRSPVGGKYDTAVDRESAFEKLSERTSAAAPAPGTAKTGAAESAAEAPGWSGALKDALFGTKRRQGMIEATAKSAMRSVGTRLGQQILRGVLGSIMGKR